MMNFNVVTFDQITDFCRQKKTPDHLHRILVLGIGGGSDVLSAYAVALKLFDSLHQLGLKSNIAYANTKRGNPPNSVSPFGSSQNHICSLTNNEVIPLTPGCQVQGSLILEESIPRNQFEIPSPLLFYLEDRKKIKNYDDYLQSFRNFLSSLNFDLIIGIDNGGDSLAKGCDPDDRDKQMLELLIGVPNTKLIHMVVAPTIDGETPPSEMLKILTEKPPNFYLGSDFLIDTYSVLAHHLPANKTPNLLIEGWRLYRENPDNTMIIDRSFLNTPPQTIPVFLVTLIAVYSDNGL